MTPKCAVCRLEDGLVINTIAASPSDLAPEGCQLIEVAEGQICDIGWTWDGVTFVAPPPLVDPISEALPPDAVI